MKLGALFVSILIFFIIVLSTKAVAYTDETQQQIVLTSPYKQTYVLAGKPNTKIQFSLKAQIIESTPVYFAYTQLMFWDIFEKSSPFKDINYNPEFFFRLKPFKNKFQWIDLVGFEHESNGKSGLASRSWNRASVLFSTQKNLNENQNYSFSLKVWFPYALSDNPDLYQFRGIGELTFSLTDILGASFERDDLFIRFYLGGKYLINPLHGGQEITLRAKLRERSFLPLFVVQLFHGYAENMLNYQQRTIALRAGIGF